MQKYKGLSELTKEYLQGTLCNLSMNYETDDFVNIHIEYTDDIYVYDYCLGINKDTHVRSFFNHDCVGHFSEVHLERNIPFEEAIETYLFAK